MISEKEMEEAIVRNPAKYIGEEGLQLVARQYSVGRYRFDLLFEDRHGGKLVVELQRGILDRTHMFKILDYCDEFRDLNPAEFVEPMIIANIIPPERKKRLAHRGISYREIPETEFTGGMLPTVDYHSAEAVARQEQTPNEAKPRHSSPITNSSIEARPIPSIKVRGYSSSEIDDLRAAILCFYQVVLPRKTMREAEGREVLREFRGKYTVEILDKVFDLADKDPTGPWFGQMLARSNRNHMYRCSIAELNALIDKLLETGDLGWLGRWRRAGNRGIKAGTATLLMYLHSPEQYNIWLPKTHRGLANLSRLDAESPKKEMSPEEYTIFYKRFNETAIAVRKEYGVAAQAMDWLLWAIGEIKENPGNRYLRAYIEGRTK